MLPAGSAPSFAAAHEYLLGLEWTQALALARARRVFVTRPPRGLVGQGRLLVIAVRPAGPEEIELILAYQGYLRKLPVEGSLRGAVNEGPSSPAVGPIEAGQEV